MNLEELEVKHSVLKRVSENLFPSSEGTTFILFSDQDRESDYVPKSEIEDIKRGTSVPPSTWATIHINGGRRDKISKGDIAGLFFKQGGLSKDQLGIIELKQDCAYVAVSRNKAGHILSKLNNSRLKKKKVRMSNMDDW